MDVISNKAIATMVSKGYSIAIADAIAIRSTSRHSLSYETILEHIHLGVVVDYYPAEVIKNEKRHKN